VQALQRAAAANNDDGRIAAGFLLSWLEPSLYGGFNVANLAWAPADMRQNVMLLMHAIASRSEKAPFFLSSPEFFHSVVKTHRPQVYRAIQLTKTKP
jgi:hypothetical protein